MCFHVEVQRAPPVNSQVNSNTRLTSYELKYVYLIGTCVWSGGGRTAQGQGESDALLQARADLNAAYD